MYRVDGTGGLPLTESNAMGQTKYTIPRHPPPGYLCHICAKASGKDPFKKPPAAKKRKPVERRQVVNFEDTESVKTLANICIEVSFQFLQDDLRLGCH